MGRRRRRPAAAQTEPARLSEMRQPCPEEGLLGRPQADARMSELSDHVGVEAAVMNVRLAIQLRLAGNTYRQIGIMLAQLEGRRMPYLGQSVTEAIYRELRRTE